MVDKVLRGDVRERSSVKEQREKDPTRTTLYRSGGGGEDELLTETN